MKLPRQELTYPSLSGMTTTLHTAPQSSETNQQTAVGLPEFSQVEFFLHTFLFKVSLKLPNMRRNIGWRVFHLCISYFRSGQVRLYQVVGRPAVLGRYNQSSPKHFNLSTCFVAANFLKNIFLTKIFLQLFYIRSAL